MPHFVDTARDVWTAYNRDCGPAMEYDGAPITLGAGKSATFETFTFRGVCPAGERHQIAVTFTLADGTPVPGTASFYWSDSTKA